MNQQIHSGTKKIQGDQDTKSLGKNKSENGASTNLSEGSNDTFDEELGHKKGEKFEFINEQTENWPQWSISQQTQQVQTDKVENQTVQQTNTIPAWDDDFMYCRGMTPAMRKRMRERREEAQRQQA